MSGTNKPAATGEHTHEAGQVRMASALAMRYNGKLIYVPGVGWHWWDGKRWRLDEVDRTTRFVLQVFKQAMNAAAERFDQAAALPDSDPEKARIEGRAKKLAADVRTCQSASGIAGVKKIAQSDERFVRESTTLNDDENLFNLQNGTLNLKSGEFQQHNPDHLITKVAAARFDLETFDRFDPNAHCPRWQRFLQEVLPNEQVREFLQTLMGLALVGKQIEHILPVLFGDGRNGKGVFYETMLTVLGDYGVTAARDLFTAAPNAHTTSQTDLMGSRLAIVDETEEGATLSESLVKSATGGGMHVARKMKQDNVRFKRTWLAVMVTNHFPRVSGKGAAIWDRLKVVEFPMYFDADHRDNTLDEVLKKEADGIFMWAYAGLVRYWRAGKLVTPEAVQRETRRQRHKNDKVQQWIDDVCERGTGPEFRVKPKDLLEAYNDWLRTQGGGVVGVDQTVGLHQFLEILRAKRFRHDKSHAVVEGLRPRPARKSA